MQGLLKQTDSYKFAHAITYGVSGGEDSDTTVRLGFRIIDTDADSSGQIVIRGVGYEHFIQNRKRHRRSFGDIIMGLNSTSVIKILDLLCEGPIDGIEGRRKRCLLR